MAVAAQTAKQESQPAAAPSGLTDRAKAERKLAYMLCAPAVLVMVLVAGFPIIYAFWLSLRREDLRFPAPGSSSASRTTSRCCSPRRGGPRSRTR